MPQQDGSAAAQRRLVDGLLDAASRAGAAGNRNLARTHLESALHLLGPGDGATAALILRRVGRAWLDDGDIECGVDCLHAALAIAEALDDTGQRAHTINVIAISHWQRGDLDRAAELYAQAGALARSAGDDQLVAMVEQNLGVIANTRADYRRALDHYTNSLERYRALGLDDDCARVINNLGMAYAALERWPEAEGAYAAAYATAERCEDTWTRLMVEVNRTALRVTQGQWDEALEANERVLREASAIRETRLLAEAHKHRGVIARQRRDFAEAESHLRTAFDEAMHRQDLLLAAETAREQAELYLVLERNREALQALSLAHRQFGRIRVPHELADVARRIHGLEQRFHDIVQQWAQSIEAKDRYTHGHCERVADYACAIARRSGFDETTMFWFRVGALLHDVGKIVVPEGVLNKPGVLTPAERRLIEAHAAAGAQLLSDIEFPWDVLPMVRSHHERWDGQGYPDRLAGETIPLPARILCVADVFDALTTDRPYRPAFPRERALAIMTGDAGRAFDPDVLSCFVELARHEPRLPAGRAATVGAD